MLRTSSLPRRRDGNSVFGSPLPSRDMTAASRSPFRSRSSSGLAQSIAICKVRSGNLDRSRSGSRSATASASTCAVPMRKTPLGAAAGESFGKCLCRIEDALPMLERDPAVVIQRQSLCLPVEQRSAKILFKPPNSRDAADCVMCNCLDRSGVRNSHKRTNLIQVHQGPPAPTFRIGNISSNNVHIRTAGSAT
jgi:hypothetical protein